MEFTQASIFCSPALEEPSLSASERWASAPSAGPGVRAHGARLRGEQLPLRLLFSVAGYFARAHPSVSSLLASVLLEGFVCLGI